MITTTATTTTKKRRRSLRHSSYTLLHLALFLTLFLSQYPHHQASAQLTPDYPTPAPVSGAAVARTKSNLFILGGSNSLAENNIPISQFITLDLTTSWPANRPAWTILNAGPANSVYPATFTADQKRMLVFHLPGTNAVYEFRVETGRWNQSTMSFASMKWQGIGAVTDTRTGLIYLASGYSDDTRLSIDIYDPVQQSVKQTKMPDPNGNQTAGVTRFGMRWFYGNVWCESRKSVLYWGGYNPSGKFNLEDNVVTELTVDNMKTTGVAPSMRADHCMAANEDGTTVLVYGGRVNNLPNGDVYILDTKTGAWRQGKQGDARMYVACTVVGNFLLIWGGTNAAMEIPSADMLIYNYVTATWLTSYTPPASYQSMEPLKIPVTGTGSTSPPSSSSLGTKPGSTTGGGGSNPVGDQGPTTAPSSDTAAIVGGTVGGLAVIAAIAGFMLYRKRQQRQGPKSPKKDMFLLNSRATTPHEDDHNGDDDDDEQDNAKKYAASFEPLTAGVVKKSRTDSFNSGGSVEQRQDVGKYASKQGPQAVVARVETALDRMITNPSASFTPVSVWGAGFARTATRLYVLSGNPTSSGVTQATDQFISLDLASSWNSSSPAWTQLTSGPRQTKFPATFTSDGKTLYVYHIPIGTTSTSVYQYSLATSQWTPVMNAAFSHGEISGIGAVVDPSTDVVYFAGGYTDIDHNKLDTWDTKTGQITSRELPPIGMPNVPDIFAMRTFYSNVWSERRKSILYFGGAGKIAANNLVSELVPATSKWSTLATQGISPPALAEHCSAASDDGTRMIVYGGRSIGTPVFGDLYLLNTVTGEWVKGAPGPARMNPVCTIAGDQFLIWGGQDGTGALTGAAMLIYNFATSTWVTNYIPPVSYPKPTPSITPTPTNSTPSGTSPTPTTGGDDEKPGSNLAAIIGGIIAVLVLVAIIIGYILYRRRQQQQKKLKKERDVKMVISSPTIGIEYDEPSGDDLEDGFGPGVNEGYRLQTPYSKLAGPQSDISVGRLRGGVDLDAVPGFHQPSSRSNPHTTTSPKPAYRGGPEAFIEEKKGQGENDGDDDGEVFEKNLKNIDNQQRLLDMQRQLLVLQQQQGHQVTRSAPQEGSPTRGSNANAGERRRMTPPGSRAPQHGSPSDTNSGVWEMITPETRAPQQESPSNSVGGAEMERPTLPDSRAPQHGSPASAVSGAAWEMMTPETRAPQHVKGNTNYLPPPPPILKSRTKRTYYPPPPPTVQTYAIGTINGNETGNVYDDGYGYGYGENNSPMPPPTHRGGHNPQTFV
ncbi:hypothetical protein BGX24_006251 [Mortierella sp. AD032]|nr:hypothetical protein BGX24_006251 [Mortierella sp. AD032]